MDTSRRTPQRVREAVGRGAPAMIYEATRPSRSPLKDILADFLVHYEANIAVHSRPFPGAVAAWTDCKTPGRQARGLHQQARAPGQSPTAKHWKFITISRP